MTQPVWKCGCECHASGGAMAHNWDCCVPCPLGCGEENISPALVHEHMQDCDGPKTQKE